jgi:hypothetical protein
VILDLFQVLQYLWAAAFVLNEASDDARTWVAQRLLKILKGNVLDVARGLRQAATKRGLVGEAKKVITTACHYFTETAEYMRYHEYLTAGLPIGSGAVEGARRYLIKDRLERAGMRWRIRGAEAVLQIRSAAVNGDSLALWNRFKNREHERLYGGPTMPSPEAPQSKAA